MKVTTVGYYKEMPHGEGAEYSIYDFINKGDKTRIDDICRYLKSGVEFNVSPGSVEDVIDPTKGVAGTASTYTDGTWLWPGDLAYYVRNYNLKLLDEFIATMEQNAWKVNLTLDDLDYDEIEIDGMRMFEDEKPPALAGGLDSAKFL